MEGLKARMRTYVIVPPGAIEGSIDEFEQQLGQCPAKDIFKGSIKAFFRYVFCSL